MSDEIDLLQNNLCTTEDAFEKFQSESMYEEDEYITLSDIVSSSQNNHDFISSIVLDQSTMDKDLSKNKQKIIANTSKNLKSNANAQYKQINSLNEFKAQHKPTKRRGRPPKSKNIYTPTNKGPENVLLNETEGDSNVSTRFSSRNRNKSIDTTRKSLKNDEVSTDIAEHDLDSEKQQSIEKTCISSPLKETHISEHIQFKENMSDSKGNISDDNMEDLPLVALCTQSTKIKQIADTVDNLKLSTEMEENKISNNITINHEKQKATETNNVSQNWHKRRGRPKKSQKSVIDTNIDVEIKNHNQQNNEEDDISLSKLKNSTILNDTHTPMITENNKDVTIPIKKLEENIEKNIISKRNLKMSDYEYNTDTIVSNDIADEKPISSDSQLVESSRPVRRKAKKNFHYDEGSDEDPFANVELSDDEPRRRKRGGRYYSDDEYIPDGEKSGNRESELTDTDTNIEKEDVELDDVRRPRKKKYRKSNIASQKSPKKISKQNYQDTSGLNDHIDIELNLETSVIKIDDNKKCEKINSWGATNEFENFLAKIVQGTDIKIKKANSIDSTKTPLQIPTIDPTEEKKSLEVSSQTDNVKTKSISVQTNTLYEIPMKNNVALTAEQSQKAIEFLLGIVKTTSELGHLMTEKSEDFIAKKINSSYVTDTFNMDNCVKKSFLLLKLAKHNLLQLEEDLSKQYDVFLKENNLIQHREEQKVISSISKDSDSDCEIVEEPIKKKIKEKIPFNPKTVFLNKELSIKIAKKPTETPKAKDKINIKGRHTVWINDSVMVKKIKPTQSFLAQDSRNKKPPDTFITMKMVSEFFKMYERQKAVSLCAPYIGNIFYQGETNYICNYFFEITNNPVKCYTTPSTEIVTFNEIGSNEMNNTVLLSDLSRSCPDSLFSICMKIVQRLMNFKSILNCKTHSKDNVFLINVTQQYDNDSDISLEDLNTNDNKIHIIKHKRKICSVFTLKNLCYKRICQLMYVPNFSENKTKKVTANFTEKSDNHTTCENNDILYCTKKSYCDIMKVKLSLSSMCVMVLQNHFNSIKNNENVKTLHKVNTLRHLSLKRIKKIFYHDSKIAVHKSVQDKNEINPVKSLSLLCMELISCKISKSGINYYDAPSGMLQNNENQTQTPHEISLKSISLEKVISLMNNGIKNDSLLNFTIDNVNTVSEDIFLENSGYNNDEIASLNDENYYSDNDLDTNYQDNLHEETNWVTQVQVQELHSCLDLAKDNCAISKENIIEDSLVKIKIEPLDDFAGNTIDVSVKIEPGDEHANLQNFSALDIITKQEDVMAPEKPAQRKYSYDGAQFESFVTSNKMLTALANYDEEEIFSQSAHRIRRQYEPDSDDDIDNLSDTMNLLIPQSEEMAKDRLMSSSDEETNKKTSNKKKIERRKPKTKKNKYQMEPTKEKTTKIEMLTRKMKEKIRIEEKKINCSDSELDDVELNLKKKNYNKVTDKSSSDFVNNLQEKEIQCNDVDSSEQIIESQTEEKNKDEITFLFSANEPVELIQCTPSIISEKYDDDIGHHVEIYSKASNKTDTKEQTYIDRYGWMCYPIDGNDIKIYRYAYIALNKLPESFVETYNKYQSISATTYIDSEIDRLTNLQSLHRSHTKDNIRKAKNISANKPKSHNAEANNHSDNEMTYEQCQELSLSEDEGDTVDHNYIDNVRQQNTENNLAKNLLMNNDSDGEEKELKINEEPKKEINVKSKSGCLIKPTRHGEAEEIMLTADKVMDKDLKFLHAPMRVEFKQEPVDAKDIDNKPNTRNSNKKLPKSNVVKIRIKDDDASSSEEEKQWFTTKEKLLKRLGKKLDTPNVDDAKRAKIVSEFIEKRNDGNGIETTRQRARPRGRSKKKLLERRKQMKILSMELFGNESHSGKKCQSQAYSKGRRNIRKVLDKKSLARSTVLANMGEFERKRRLVQREAQLREVLGCEEGVNVVVINDELCLEYDFENKLPLVTVHSFFTKVMKAHQYEGVKFMWDACFESVSATQRGGGGCILAHCMGLGKTLQVLALLHTVLTHPQLSMRRVLVCCPLSTVLNWVDEINKWIGPVTNKIKVFELSKLKKTYERAYQLEDWYNGGGIFIIGYELFRSLTTLDPVMDRVRPTIVNKIRTALLDPGPDIVICDEGHLLKNDSSVLAVAMSRIVTKRRIILTGTPMQNNLREYYCMVNFVKPNLLGTYSEYSNRFENPIMNGQHRDSREEDIKLMKARTHILHKVLEGCLQRQEASVLYPYLPKKHEYTVFISQSKCQWDLYKHYLKNYTKGTKQSVLKDFHILQKIWTHPLVLHSFLTRARGDGKEVKIKAEKMEDDLAQEDLIASEDIKPSATETETRWWLPHVVDSNSLDSLESSNKFLIVFHLLDECIALDDKVLIFSTSLYTMDSLEYFLRRIKQWSLGKEYYRLDGSVPAEVRQKWCREFNAPNNTTTKLFLISTRAGSLGLNMTAANRVIILDTSWNPAHDIQSIFRVYRFGQKKDCYIYRLVAMGTMEQKMYERSVTKQAVACRVVDEQQIDRHYNMAELSELYRLDEDGYSVAAGLAPGVRDGVLLRVAYTLGTTEGPGVVNARLHAVHEHDSLLRGSEETGLPEHERNAAWMQFQQEHSSTHNNIQNIEIKIPSIQNKAKDQRGIEIKQESTDKPKRNNFRSKKSKKNVNVENDVTALPSTSAQTELNLAPDLGEERDRRILSILIKNKFHEAKGTIEIPVLITKVRNAIANIDESGLDNIDPLIASLARVVIASEKPIVNDTKTGNLNGFINTDMDVKPAIEITVGCNARADADDHLGNCGSERKRKNEKADSDEEYVPEAGPSRTGRKNKKIELLDRNTNKKSKETRISDNAQTNSILPNIVNYGVQKSILMQAAQSLPNSESSRNVISDRENNNSNNKQTEMSIDKNNTEEISIILSDDESDRETIRYKSNKEKVKPVPLHRSLLTNKNFIKIVAHTYLTGNPRLDEDAAMLAAQYSTFKALKEVEMTGKDIDSGPIYDIAAQVIGVSVLEKIQSVRNKQDDVINNEVMSLSVTSILNPNETTTSSQIDKTELTIQQDINLNKNTPTTSKKPEKPNLKKNKESDNSFNIEPVLSENLTATSPVPTEVVPVGMFIGPASIQPSEPPAHEECILPDDDDIIFTDSIPATTTPLNINKVNSQIAVNNISSISQQPAAISSPKRAIESIKRTPGSFDPGAILKSNRKSKIAWTPKTTATQSTKQNQNATVKKRTLENLPTTANGPLPKTAPSCNQSSEKLNETICLDSDEEETIVSTHKLKAKALKSTTKLPILLTSKVKNNKTLSSAKPVKKIRPQTVLNTVRTETDQTSDATSAVKKVLSKQDQIIRISKGGEIELLRRTDIVTTQPNTVISKAERNKPRILKIAKKSINVTTSKPVDVLNLTDSDNENRSSVFQNVVHICADKYEEVNKAITIDEAETITPTIIKDGTKPIKIKLNKEPSTETTKAIVTNVNGKNKITLKFPSNDVSRSKEGEKVIDLTETFVADKKVLIVKKRDWDKVSGSSKDIIINKVGALYKTSMTASTSVDVIKQMNTASTKKSASVLKVTPSGSVKRLSSTKESTAKKKPEPKKPLMLQDFDIDDIDDIIELE